MCLKINPNAEFGLKQSNVAECELCHAGYTKHNYNRMLII